MKNWFNFSCFKASVVFLFLFSSNLYGQTCTQQPTAYGGSECSNLGSKTFSASNYNPPSIITGYRWYTVQTGGTTIGTSQAVKNSFVNQYNTTFDYTISSTTTLWVAAICSSGEESPRSSATFTITGGIYVDIQLTGDPLAVCQGTQFPLTAKNASNFTWYYAVNDVESQYTYYGNVATIYPTISGFYKLTGNSPCFNNQSAKRQIVIIPRVGPASSITGISSRCMGVGTSNFSSTATTATSQQWSITGAQNSSINSSGVVTWDANFSGTATISVTFSGCGGSQSSTSKQVTVNACPCNVPTAGAISGCKGGTYTLTARTENTSYPTLSHKWYNSSGGLLAQTNASQVTAGIWQSSYDHYFSASESLFVSTVCPSGESAKSQAIFTVTPPPSIRIKPNIYEIGVCEGVDFYLTAERGKNYQWFERRTIDDAWQPFPIVAPSTTTVIYPTKSGFYKLVGLNSCDVAEETQILISITPKVKIPNAISGISERCVGAGTSTFLGQATDFIAYQWSMTGGGASNINASTGVVTWDPTSDQPATIKFSANGCNGSAAERTLNVTIKPKPPLATVNSPAPLCGTGETEFSATYLNAPAGYSLVWYTSTARSQIVPSHRVTEGVASYVYKSVVDQTNYSATTTYYVASTLNGCESDLQAVTVTVANNLNLSAGDVSLCGNGTAILRASAPAGSSFTWIDPSGNAVGENKSTYTTPFLSTTTNNTFETFNYSVRISVPNMCTKTLPVKVHLYANYLPPVVTGPDICEGSSATLLAKGPDGKSMIWNWYDSTGVQLYSGPSSTFTTPVLTKGRTFYVAYTLTQAPGCTSGRFPYFVKVDRKPVANLSLSGTKTICSTCEQSISTVSNDTYKYQWYKNQTPINEASFASYAIKEDGDYKVEIISKSCAVSSPVFRLIKNRVATVNAGQDRTVDLAVASAITLNGSATDSDGSISSYLWKKLTGPSVTMSSSTTANLSLSGLNPGVYAFILTAKDNFGEESFDEVMVKVPTPNNYNYVTEILISKDSVVNKAQIDQLATGQKLVTYNYFDGLGRGIQTVQMGMSPLGNDVVKPVVYDSFGREKVQFLPYVSTQKNGWYKIDPTGENTTYTSSPQYQFYQAGNDKIVNDVKPYSEALFEKSPINRALKQGAPGAVFQPNNSNYIAPSDRSVKFSYEFNTADEVLLWTYSYPTATYPLGIVNAGATNTSRIYHPVNQLYKNRTKDEHHNEVIEYKDKEGKVLLKKVQLAANEYAQTYYIYDDFGKLVCVLPPEAVAGVLKSPTSDYFGQTDVVKNAFLKRWAFRYRYDERQRMVEKQVPGSGPVQMFYDPWDRVVLIQDSIQRGKNQYLYTKYDALSRPIITGVWTSANTKAQINTGLDTLKKRRYEALASTQHGYTLTQAFPFTTTAASALTVTYYDDYRFVGQTWFEETTGRKYTYHTKKTGYPNSYNSRVKGQVTAQKVKTLRGNNWLNSVTYYDNKYRLIRVIAENQVGGADTVSTSYDFVGKLLKSKSEHSGIKAVIVTKRYEYDHAGRLLKLYNQVDSNPEILLAENKYNELGQLVEKGIGVKNNVPVQSIDYRYNIRGWLSNINRSDLTSDSGAKNDDTNDLFGMELLYEQTTY